MASDLALAADPDVIERSADPAGYVVQACERAKAWLTEALEHGGIERIAEIKSQAEAVRVYTAQKQLGKDAQLAAAEIVRRAERGIGLAIRRGQQNGEIAKRGDCGSRGAPGVHGGNPGDRRGDHLGSPGSFFRHGDERADAYAMTDGVSDTDFEDALGDARAERNLSRANVVRKIRQRDGDPPASDQRGPDPGDRSADAAARRLELIGEFAGTACRRGRSASGSASVMSGCARSPANTASISGPTPCLAGPGGSTPTGSCGRRCTPWRAWRWASSSPTRLASTRPRRPNGPPR
jgi:hypothetical protein